jgi:hypothetical protein
MPQRVRTASAKAANAVEAAKAAKAAQPSASLRGVASPAAQPHRASLTGPRRVQAGPCRDGALTAESVLGRILG